MELGIEEKLADQVCSMMMLNTPLYLPKLAQLILDVKQLEKKFGKKCTKDEELVKDNDAFKTKKDEENRNMISQVFKMNSEIEFVKKLSRPENLKKIQ